MNSYDVIILGGGPAGYNSAAYAARNGLRAALAEKAHLGGTCLNEGCIPTKSLLYAAKLHHQADAAEAYGVHAGQVFMDHAQAVAKKNEVVGTLVGGVAAGLRREKVTVLMGEAVIESSSGGFEVSVNGESISGKHLIVATGSVPAVPPIEGAREGLEQGYVLTSSGLLALTELPRELVIIGGGVIGFEMAAYFLEAGSHVTVIEQMDKILGANDREVSHLLQKEMERRGMTVYLSAGVTGITWDAVQFTKDGKNCSVAFDKVLLSVGRRPNSSLRGLRETGVQMERGALVTDECCRTSVAGMYAIGDVNGKSTLAHVGYREGEVAVNDILGRKDAMDYSAVCGVVYTQPEAAFVGLSEEQAKASGIRYSVRKASINFSGRHVVENGMSSGVCKLLIDDRHDVILGAALMSAYASEYVYALALMIQNKIPLASIRRTVFPHPTVCEIIREAILQEQ